VKRQFKTPLVAMAAAHDLDHDLGRALGSTGKTMAYMLLVVEKAGDRAARSQNEGGALYDRMLRFSENLKRRGLLTMSQSLKTDTDGARVTKQGEKSLVRDGPFIEAKEMIGGFFLLTCTSREQAIEIARECPAGEWATIEVRELGPCFQ
jgi:hypothetical protein